MICIKLHKKLKKLKLGLFTLGFWKFSKPKNLCFSNQISSPDPTAPRC